MHYFDASTSPFTRWAAARTDAFVAVSEYVQARSRRCGPRHRRADDGRANGVDTAYLEPEEHERGQRAGEPFTAAVVCRLTGWKRVELSLEAAAIARHGPWSSSAMARSARRSKRCAQAGRRRARFVGHQADPRPFVAACDVLLSTAEDEPLGLSVLEALAMARPVDGLRAREASRRSSRTARRAIS